MIKIVIDNVDVTALVSNIEWSGEYQQAARRINFSIVASPYDINVPKPSIKLGSKVIFYVDNKEVFRGIVFTKDKSYNGNAISFTAFDNAIYLLKNEGSYNFKNVTAESVVSRICSDFAISAGSIAKTGINVNKKFIGGSLYDIVMSCYTIASQNNSKKYMVQAKEGKINIIEKGNVTLDLIFSNGVNLLDSSYSESIENMVNRVRIVDKDGNKVKDVDNSDWLKSYGSFQRVLTQSDGKDSTKEANKMLQGIDSKISITGFGDVTCVTGMGVKVYDSYTGLTGLFYIDGDSHKWTNGVYTVDLTLNLKNLMNENEGGEVNE